MDLPFKVLHDPDNKVRQRYCAYDTSIYVADKFSGLRLQTVVPNDLDSVLNSVINVMELAELECPECGVGSWPTDESEPGSVVNRQH